MTFFVKLVIKTQQLKLGEFSGYVLNLFRDLMTEINMVELELHQYVFKAMNKVKKANNIIISQVIGSNTEKMHL